MMLEYWDMIESWTNGKMYNKVIDPTCFVILIRLFRMVFYRYGEYEKSEALIEQQEKDLDHMKFYNVITLFLPDYQMCF